MVPPIDLATNGTGLMLALVTWLVKSETTDGALVLIVLITLLIRLGAKTAAMPIPTLLVESPWISLVADLFPAAMYGTPMQMPLV